MRAARATRKDVVIRVIVVRLFILLILIILFEPLGLTGLAEAAAALWILLLAFVTISGLTDKG